MQLGPPSGTAVDHLPPCWHPVRSVEAGIFDVTAPTDTARALLGMVQSVAAWFQPEGRLPAQVVAAQYLDVSAHAVGATPAILRRVREGSAAVPA